MILWVDHLVICMHVRSLHAMPLLHGYPFLFISEVQLCIVADMTASGHSFHTIGLNIHPIPNPN